MLIRADGRNTLHKRNVHPRISREGEIWELETGRIEQSYFCAKIRASRFMQILERRCLCDLKEK